MPRTAGAVRSPHRIQGLKSVEMPRIAVARRGCWSDARQAPEEDRQRHLHLQPCEGRADAEMNACTEGDMREEWARRVECAWLRVALRVAIGGAKKHADLLAFTELNARHLGRLERVALEEMERRVEAERLFHDGRGPCLRREQRLRVEVRFEDGLHRIANCMDGRLVASVEQLDTTGDELVIRELVAGRLRRDEMADEVVSGRLPPQGDVV